MNGKTAVVIGAGMGGLMAARVLADVFDRVVIIERDTLSDSGDMRSGIPQGRHIHALLHSGQQILEELFPGLSDELTAGGSPQMTWCRDTAYLTAGGWIKRFDSKIVTNVINRPDLEYRVRRRVTACKNVEFLTGREVTALITTPDKSRVTGVEVSVRGGAAEEHVTADLVVDVSGRGSKAPEWLQALGYAAPTESAVTSNVGYSTRAYEKPDRPFDWKILFILARSAENNPRGGGIFDIGGGKWLVSLGGLNADYPPTDEAGFEAYAKALPSGTFAEAISTAKPISPIVGYRIPGSRRRHYEKLTRRPENFIALGDAVCAFNPIYGQGMTVAAKQVIDLRDLLKQYSSGDFTGLATAFHKRIVKSIENAWLLATGEDLRFPKTVGDRPNGIARLVQRYLDQYLRVSYQDELLTLTFIEVANLTAPPSAFFRPAVIARVIALSLRARGKTHKPNVHLIPSVE